MPWHANFATTPKDEGDENQDATHIDRDWIAIADGTSSGFDSGRWARALVRDASQLLGDALRQLTPSEPSAATKSRSVDFVVAAGERLTQLQRRHHDLAIASSNASDSAYVRDAQARGGSSTLAIACMSPDRRSLTLVALGDTCWFVIRDGAIRCAFPLKDARDFPEQPRLLYSTPGRLGSHSRAFALTRAIRVMRDPSHPSSDIAITVPFEPSLDQLLGCTDAVACWLLSAAGPFRSRRLQDLLHSLRPCREGIARIERVRHVPARKRKRREQAGQTVAVEEAQLGSTLFPTLVDRERAANHLKRDDSTVVLATWVEDQVL